MGYTSSTVGRKGCLGAIFCFVWEVVFWDSRLDLFRWLEGIISLRFFCLYLLRFGNYYTTFDGKD